MMKTLEALKLNGQLPSPKGVALAILEICRRDDATMAEIARVVQTDPALSGRLLRQANSAAGGRRPAASVPEAVMRMGLTAVRQLALGFSLVDQHQNGPCQAFDYQRFWSHSLMMALAMRRFVDLVRVGAPEDLFACGLLARVGYLGLATIYPAEYARILDGRPPTDALIERERRELQTDHRELTAALLMDWGIPKALVEPIFYHETPAASGFSEGSRPYQLVHLFHLAKSLADLGIGPESERAERISGLILLGGKIGLDADQFGTVFNELVGEWREWGELLKIPVHALPSFSQMAHAPAPHSKPDASPAALRVLVVDDEPTTRFVMTNVLAKTLGHTVFTASDGREALALALEVMPQIVVTDWKMPVMDGIALCRALRASDWGQTMYVIMLTNVETDDEIIQAFEAGVDDYITKPLNIRALRARLRAAWHYVTLLESWERDRARLNQFASELAISNRRLEHTAQTDLLTDLPNRRFAMHALSQAWQGANRHGQPMAVMLIDIDHFKDVNDKYGHAVGDIALKEVGRAIQASTRKDESVCRFGGEEFLMVCGSADLRSVFEAAERLRKRIESLRITVGEIQIKVTISVGVCSKDPEALDEHALVDAADTALYAAKNLGRNRTCAISGGKIVPGHPGAVQAGA